MEFASLLWQHAEGDSFKVPCQHLQAVQTGSVSIDVPTKIDVGTQHSDDGKWRAPTGQEYTIPCMHWNTNVTTGTAQVPTFELRPQHPDGDDSPVHGPCIHALTPSAVDSSRHLVFFTDDPQYQMIVTQLVDKLRNELHVRTVGSSARPLMLFFREAVRGNPNDSTDPFWSHYDPFLHAIQITRNPTGIDYDSVRAVLSHELGHAIVGQSCVQVPNEGDPHSMKRPSHPGEAMSEGWADFVAVALARTGRGTPHSLFAGASFEERDPAVPLTTDIEYNIMCLLWDLYDVETVVQARPPRIGRVIPDDDSAATEATAFSFEELFGVFSPSLDTLPAGPVIWDIRNYLGRLRTMYPERASVIDSVQAVHVQ